MLAGLVEGLDGAGADVGVALAEAVGVARGLRAAVHGLLGEVALPRRRVGGPTGNPHLGPRGVGTPAAARGAVEAKTGGNGGEGGAAKDGGLRGGNEKKEMMK